MKKALLILTIIFTYQISNAQGTLQFNSVINKAIVSDGSRSVSDGSMGVFATFTVPENKIWKITYFSANYKYLNNNGISTMFGSYIQHKGPNDTNLSVIWNYDLVSSSGWNEHLYFGPGVHSLYAMRFGITGILLVSMNGIEYNIISN